MSTIRAGAVSEERTRIPRDGYFTPEPLAMACARELHQFAGTLQVRRILEPSSGGGAFVRAARNFWPAAEINAVDISPGAELFARAAGAEFTCADFLRTPEGHPHDGPFDLILGNPPYQFAAAHVRHAMTLLRGGGVLAFLLRLSFLGSKERAFDLSTGDGRYIAPIVPRPSFTADGATDSSEYALFCWKRHSSDASILGDPIHWVKPKRGAA